MSRIQFFALLAAAMAFCGVTSAQEVIKPRIAPAFGEPVVVRAEFVDKSNDYYSQNMISAPFALKVLAVNDVALPEPIVIEYNLAVDKKERSMIEKKGTTLLLEAYETLYQPSTATPWLADGMQGSRFVLEHLLHVRPPQSKR
jgi:hypothetical protein